MCTFNLKSLPKWYGDLNGSWNAYHCCSHLHLDSCKTCQNTQQMSKYSTNVAVYSASDSAVSLKTVVTELLIEYLLPWNNYLFSNTMVVKKFFKPNNKQPVQQKRRKKTCLSAKNHQVLLLAGESIPNNRHPWCLFGSTTPSSIQILQVFPGGGLSIVLCIYKVEVINKVMYFNKRHWSAKPSAQQCTWLYLCVD